tara:strand:- start:170 stop:832 length:663 start_codon:yes stop_codon:yes gene_type:complete
MAWWIPLTASVIGGIMTNRAGKRNIRMAREDAAKAFKEQQKQQKLLADQMDEYKSQSFSNPYAENVFEDLTVNQKQAQFQVQQGNQQRSDLLQRLKQSAQGSGIASLAQSLANQGVLQTQRISANIGVQESQNQMAAAKGQLRVQQGEEMLQNKNADMQSTLLGIQYGQATGANQNYQQMQQNVYGARSSAAAANAAAVQGVVDAASGTTFPKIKPPGTP